MKGIGTSSEDLRLILVETSKEDTSLYDRYHRHFSDDAEDASILTYATDGLRRIGRVASSSGWDESQSVFRPAGSSQESKPIADPFTSTTYMGRLCRDVSLFTSGVNQLR